MTKPTVLRQRKKKRSPKQSRSRSVFWSIVAFLTAPAVLPVMIVAVQGAELAYGPVGTFVKRLIDFAWTFPFMNSAFMGYLSIFLVCLFQAMQKPKPRKTRRLR